MILEPNKDLSRLTLTILERSFALSAKAIKVCEVNELTHLGNILDFYDKHQSFLKLKGTGEKTSQELTAICEHFYTHPVFYEKIIDKSDFYKQWGNINPAFLSLPLDKKEIINHYIQLKIKVLSIRVAHVVIKQLDKGIDFDDFAQKFLKEKTTISSFQNIGLKSLQELAAFVDNVEQFALTQVHQTHETGQLVKATLTPEQNEVSIHPKLQNLSRLKKQLMDNYIELEIKNLSKKTQQLIFNPQKQRILFDNFAEIFLKSNYNSIQLFNNRSIHKELLALIQNVETKGLVYADIRHEEIPFYEFMILLRQIFNLQNLHEAIFLPFIQKKAFPVFYFFDYLIKNRILINSKFLTIFKNRLDYWEDQPLLSLNTTGEQLNLTRERVRQLTVNLETKLNLWWQFLENYSILIQSFTNYNFKSHHDFLSIEPTLRNEINQVETTQFSKSFFEKTFRHLYHQTHVLLGSDFGAFRNAYLIRLSLFENFSYTTFFETVYHQTKTSLHKDLILDMDAFLEPFLQKDRLDLLQRIRVVCEKILLNEFSDTITLDSDNHIIFKRNSKTNGSEILVEILREKGVPMKIEELYELFHPKYSQKANSSEIIRRIIGQEKGLFIFFGRTSTYGLAEWEQTQEAIKGGTIRSIIETYLESFEEPKHISELTEFVSKYRPTSSLHSIQTNLQFDKSNRFKELKGGFWGLTSKNYENLDFKKHPKFFFKYVVKMIHALPEADYETIVFALCEQLQLKKAQVQYLIENNIKKGYFKRENNVLKIDPNYGSLKSQPKL